MRSLHRYFAIKMIIFDAFTDCISPVMSIEMLLIQINVFLKCLLTTFPNVRRPKPYLYKNDHTYPGVNKTDVPFVILYAEIGTKKFTSFHKVLSEKAEEGTLIYVLRHFVAVSSNAFAAILKGCSTDEMFLSK